MDLGTALRIPLPWRVQVALRPLQSVEVELALQIMVQHLPVALVLRDALAADLQERARQMEMLFLQTEGENTHQQQKWLQTGSEPKSSLLFMP